MQWKSMRETSAVDDDTVWSVLRRNSVWTGYARNVLLCSDCLAIRYAAGIDSTWGFYYLTRRAATSSPSASRRVASRRVASRRFLRNDLTERRQVWTDARRFSHEDFFTTTFFVLRPFWRMVSSKNCQNRIPIEISRHQFRNFDD